MRPLISMVLISLSSVTCFAQESVVIEGKFVHSKNCNPKVLANAVVGKISDSRGSIQVCAEDVLSLKDEDFTNGAKHSALIDYGTYFIVGKLHEGTLSVAEVAMMRE